MFNKLSIIALGLIFTASAAAQDVTRLGGDLTSDLALTVALELPAPNIRSEEAYQYHLAGHTDFHGSFFQTSLNGQPVVGPFFNNTSCGGCHAKNGRGDVGFFTTTPVSAMIVKLALPGYLPDGSPKPVPGVGVQLQDRSISGATRYRIQLKWKQLKGRYPDGSPYYLRSPVLNYRLPGKPQPKAVSSLRITPQVIGMGLLEAIPDQTLEALSDPNDLDRDGVSGRVSYVADYLRNTISVGRFGFKAAQPSLKQQSAAAFFHDMGMTSDVFTDGVSQQEVSTELLERTTFYLQVAGIPPAREQDHPDVILGKSIFQQIGCQSCHTMTLRTGESSVQEVANQEIHPFTDLLLHDMGPGLAEKFAEFTASGREWRTTPLWGLGLAYVLRPNVQPRFLHDGRARTIEEAILWHDGEALASRNRFKNLSFLDRLRLIRFLLSL